MTLKAKFTEWKGKATAFYEKNKFVLSVVAAGLGFALLVGLVFVLTPSEDPVAKPTPVVEVSPAVVETTPAVVVKTQPKVKVVAKTPHKDLIIGGVEPKEVEKSAEIPQKTAPVAEKTTKYQTEEDEKTLQSDYKDSLTEYKLLAGQQ
jgi:hypothetical protein